MTRQLRIHVYTLTPAEMDPHSAEGSIIIPATSRQAVAVGAIDVHSDELQPSSSRGPTDDLRTKPDVTAPGQQLVRLWCWWPI